MARSLRLPNADAINWSLVASSTSDSAATQKRFNRLMEERKEADIERFGETSADDALEILENFYAMHLGTNLRKAFLSATKEVGATDQQTCNGRDQMCWYMSAVSLLADMVHLNMAPVFLSSLTFWR